MTVYEFHTECSRRMGGALRHHGCQLLGEPEADGDCGARVIVCHSWHDGVGRETGRQRPPGTRGFPHGDIVGNPTQQSTGPCRHRRVARYHPFSHMSA